MGNPRIPPAESEVEQLLPAQGLTAVGGRNFSGRTERLRQFVGLGTASSLDKHHPGRCAFIGPEIYNALSGLALSVEDEIRLHFHESESPINQDSLIETMGLAPMRARNPFELSGGEQALTALAAGLALFPKRLSLDCCFEQVDAHMRQRVLDLLRPWSEHGTGVAIADNRLVEYAPGSFHRVATLKKRTDSETGSPELTPVRAPAEVADVSAPAITLRGIQFSYRRRGTAVLRDLSLSLEPGNIYLVDGKNGSGKSTLAKILCGAIRPQHGIVLADGKPYSPWREPGRVFAYHFQNPDLQLFCSTVEDELLAGPKALGVNSTPMEVSARRWANVFGLSPALKSHPLDMPFVGRKRVAMAATLTMERPWVILDEPTLGQDDKTSETLAVIIGQLAARGHGVLVISHSANFRRRLGGHRLLIEEGVVAEQH